MNVLSFKKKSNGIHWKFLENLGAKSKLNLFQTWNKLILSENYVCLWFCIPSSINREKNVPAEFCFEFLSSYETQNAAHNCVKWNWKKNAHSFREPVACRMTTSPQTLRAMLWLPFCEYRKEEGRLFWFPVWFWWVPVQKKKLGRILFTS